MVYLYVVVKCGKVIGIIFIFYVYEDGLYVVSLMWFEKDYVWVFCEIDFLVLIKKGYKLCMSNFFVKNYCLLSLIVFVLIVVGVVV